MTSCVIIHEDSWQWNTFRITSSLWGEYIGPRFPTNRANDSIIWCFLVNLNMMSINQSVTLPGSWDDEIPWASCQIRKIAGAHALGMPGMFSPSPQVSDPDMHHGTCVTHVLWCMPGSLTSSFLWNWWRGKTFPAFPTHGHTGILRIW